MTRFRGRTARWITAALIAALPLGCDEPAERCPASFSLDDARTTSVRDQLGGDAEGRRLLQAAGARHVVCWGMPDTSVVDEQRRVMMDRRLSKAAAAAKLGHLLHHVIEGMPLAEGCARLDLAEARERKAHALEARLRLAFGAPPEKEGALERVLAGYRARCSSH